jgi:hypothetical protein
MSKRKDVQPEVPDGTREPERPMRPAPEPKEAPGGKDAGKAEQDARNKSTRRGDR